MTTTTDRLVLMREDLFLEFVRLLTQVNKKKYAIQWGDAVGHDYVTGEELYVPTVYVGPDDTESGTLDD